MNLIKKADLARMGKVQSSLVSRNVRKNGIWYHAVDEATGFIDTEDQVIANWLELRSNVKSHDDMTLKDYEHLTLKTIINEYGSIPQFQELSKTYKTLADTEHRKIQIEASRNELVSREHVGKVCFGYLEMLNKRLLEMPSGRIPKIMAIIESDQGDAKEKVVEALCAEIAKILKGVKRDLINRLDEDFTEKA